MTLGWRDSNWRINSQLMRDSVVLDCSQIVDCTSHFRALRSGGQVAATTPRSSRHRDDEPRRMKEHGRKRSVPSGPSTMSGPSGACMAVHGESGILPAHSVKHQTPVGFRTPSTRVSPPANQAATGSELFPNVSDRYNPRRADMVHLGLATECMHPTQCPSTRRAVSS